MSRSSRRRKRRARAARVGHGRGKGRRWILLNPPGASADEMLARLLMCMPRAALEDLTGRLLSGEQEHPHASNN